MIIDVGIAIDLAFEVKKPVPGEQLQHVRHKLHRAIDLRLAGAVEINGERYLCFAGIAFNGGCSRHWLPPFI
ncbi:hypothetical protein SDC9_201088 [bioreactor metagenome]|uniref:Uncharacterized protein n=1 Tax=bioreactor metagenome TaxID=1076179 RepID=A0A645IYT4_9ZZZZ